MSAGNYATFDNTADNPSILTISATDSSDILYSWSNTGNNVDLAAPGCVYTTMSGGGYGAPCGTSFSAPIVAGVAGLVLSASPNLTAAELTGRLRSNADDLGTPGFDGWVTERSGADPGLIQQRYKKTPAGAGGNRGG